MRRIESQLAEADRTLIEPHRAKDLHLARGVDRAHGLSAPHCNVLAVQGRVLAQAT